MRKYFELFRKRALEVKFLDSIELDEILEINFESYLLDSVLKSLLKSEEGVSMFVSFFSDYIKGASLWFEMFCGLVRALGCEDFSRVLFKQMEIEACEHSIIDENYLKFQIRSCFDLYLNDTRLALLSTYEKAKELPKVVHYTESEFAKRLIQVVQGQNEDWAKILNEIYFFYETILLNDNTKEIIEYLKKIINYFVEMAERLQIVHEFIIPHKSWEDLLIEDIQKLGIRIEEIKKEISVIADYRINHYRNGLNATLFLLRMLWGSEELATKKLENFILSKVSIDELIPEKIKLGELSFGLVGALEEFNLARQAVEVLKEKTQNFEDAAYILGSQIFKSLYDEIIEEIKMHEYFWVEMYEALLTIQDLTVDALNEGQV